MTASGRPIRHAFAVIALCAIAAILVLASGCTQQAPTAPGSAATTPSAATTMSPVPATTTSEGKKMVTFTENDNGTTVDIGAGSRFAIQLAENPTTGYSWNASTSSGLTILSSDYQENKHAEGMVGVGGVRTWILQAGGSGDQTFRAIYSRSWEPVTGNETAYSLNVRVSTP